MDLTNLQTIKSLLQKHGLYAKKYLGQNFLTSSKVLEKIISAATETNQTIENFEESKTSKTNQNPKLPKTVLEIGPGLGVLTKELAQTFEQVISLELDNQLFPIHQETLKDFKNIKIEHQDALRYEIPENLDYQVVANIPYNITSPLINHFLQAKNKNKPKSLTLLVQKEVAEKICQKDPKMSVLSLQVALFGEAKYVDTVTKENFFPIPKVDSAILHIEVFQEFSDLKDSSNPSSLQKLQILKLAHRAFKNARKKLSNTLPELKDKLTKLQLHNKRPQHLAIEDWQKLITELQI